MIESALHLAALGYAVFPIQPNDKRPFGGTHGCKDATRDKAVIRSWPEKYPNGFNLAVATGTPSGCWALDIDQKRNGRETLASLEDKHGRLPDTVLALTAGGGLHYLFRMPQDRDVRNVNDLFPGIDVRGTGGYIVVSPSTHPNGKQYEWEASSAPGEVPLADAPEWLLSALSGGSDKPQPSSAVANHSGPVHVPSRKHDWEVVPEGKRHDILHRTLGALRRQAAPLDVLLSAARQLNSHFQPPFDDAILIYQSEWALGHWQPDDSLSSYQPAPTTDKWLWKPVGLKEAFSKQIPALKWLIPGIIASASVGYIGSPPKVGKSWLSQHILLCGATGKAFLGMPEFLGGTFKGAYISEEDPERMVYSRAKRMWDGLNPSVSPDGQMLLIVKQGFRLDKPECLATLEETIVSAGLELVILDVLNRLHSKDGNKAEEIIPLLASLDAIRTRTGCSILLDAHFKKGLGDDAGTQGQRLSGTVGLHGWSENSIYLDWPKAQGGQAILNFEAKEFPPHDPIVFSIGVPEGEDEDDPSAPLVLTGKPLADGTKKGVRTRQSILVAWKLALEKTPLGATVAEIKNYMQNPPSDDTMHRHLKALGAIIGERWEGRVRYVVYSDRPNEPHQPQQPACGPSKSSDSNTL